VSTNCVTDKIVSLRKEMIKSNQKVSLNDFIIKAIALALRVTFFFYIVLLPQLRFISLIETKLKKKMVPEVNSNYDDKTNAYTQLGGVDISVAVATDKGLITPIVKDADKLSVKEISDRVKVCFLNYEITLVWFDYHFRKIYKKKKKTLATKARDGKLLPHEFQGGSFSISNLGMFGVKEFSAVINPPQVGILAVGSSQTKFNAQMQAQTEMSLTLSYDERCVSLDRAMKFLTTLNYFLANPDVLVDRNEPL
jgi:dihydrolipoamide dehydrogenase-binding protein of pyruvate dehydrogenase complex